MVRKVKKEKPGIRRFVALLLTVGIAKTINTTNAMTRRADGINQRI